MTNLWKRRTCRYVEIDGHPLGRTILLLLEDGTIVDDTAGRVKQEARPAWLIPWLLKHDTAAWDTCTATARTVSRWVRRDEWGGWSYLSGQPKSQRQQIRSIHRHLLGDNRANIVRSGLALH